MMKSLRSSAHVNKASHCAAAIRSRKSSAPPSAPPLDPPTPLEPLTAPEPPTPLEPLLPADAPLEPALPLEPPEAPLPPPGSSSSEQAPDPVNMANRTRARKPRPRIRPRYRPRTERVKLTDSPDAGPFFGKRAESIDAARRKQTRRPGMASARLPIHRVGRALARAAVASIHALCSDGAQPCRIIDTATRRIGVVATGSFARQFSAPEHSVTR
jgi:hypothetical protein